MVTRGEGNPGGSQEQQDEEALELVEENREGSASACLLEAIGAETLAAPGHLVVRQAMRRVGWQLPRGYIYNERVPSLYRVRRSWLSTKMLRHSPALTPESRTVLPHCRTRVQNRPRSPSAPAHDV